MKPRDPLETQPEILLHARLAALEEAVALILRHLPQQTSPQVSLRVRRYEEAE